MKISETKKLAIQEMEKHGLIENGWYLEMDNRSTRRFGACWGTRKKITLTTVLCKLNDEPKVLDTIRHEIAHALAGVGHGHDQVWKNMCAQTGASPERCYSDDVVRPPRKEPQFVGVCPNCGYTKRSYARRKVACGHCCRLFNNNRYADKYALKWGRKI